MTLVRLVEHRNVSSQVWASDQRHESLERVQVTSPHFATDFQPWRRQHATILPRPHPISLDRNDYCGNSSTLDALAVLKATRVTSDIWPV